MTRTRRWSAAAILSLALLGVSDPAGSASRAFVWSGACRGGSIVVPVAREDIRRFVPRGFALAADQSGLVPFALQVFDCSDVVIGGAQSEQVVVSEALVVLDRERSPALAGQPESDVDFYIIPTPSDSDLLRAMHRKLGLRHEVNRRMRVTWSETAGIAQATGSAPGDFELRATAFRAVPPQDWAVCCTWQLGSRGLVRTRFELSTQTFDAGAGELTAVPGSPMYEILGGRRQKHGAGVARSFWFRGTVELMGRPSPDRRGVGARHDHRLTVGPSAY